MASAVIDEAADIARRIHQLAHLLLPADQLQAAVAIVSIRALQPLLTLVHFARARRCKQVALREIAVDLEALDALAEYLLGFLRKLEQAPRILAPHPAFDGLHAGGVRSDERRAGQECQSVSY